MGRPTKLTPALQKRVAAAVRKGATREIAAASAGIAASTFFDWMARGEACEARFSEFSEAVKKAEAECAMAALGQIQTASRKTWTAAAWLLERRYRQGYAQPQKVQHEHSGPGGKPISVDVQRRDLALEMLEQLVTGGLSHDDARRALAALGVRDHDLEPA